MNVRLQYNTVLTAGVHYDGCLQMNNYNIKVYMVTNTVESECHNIAYERLKLFIHKFLESSVFIDQSEKEFCKLYTDAGIRLTTLPSLPIDQIIGIMLYCKLNAIMENYIHVVEVEISSSLGDQMVYFHCEEENLGPFEDDGWWHGPDDIQCDLTQIFGKDNVMSLNRGTIPWKEFGLNWPEVDHQTSDSGNTIIFTDFNRNDTK